ncbi:peptidoglycan DD-metalloendopeptidase family protein [Halobacillus amylolyticus]|uniref:Peptidoglycan DD-metalloendopeptidase family protein n=1 Tax=Halobacillus amylolyticus TaxID=2932259 RepID=A0ABY4H7F2_9BACI|nr:M23 family metallopeptidase [Halobacillus amylolyticus]UOR10795.1 peptidoglycan DD-metalloendopeptidase family protein [Halobacillus amylolyticus]
MDKTTGLWKKVAIMTLLGIGLSLGTTYAESNLETIYHVYVGDKHIGAVNDKEIVQSYVDQRLNQAQEENENLRLTTKEEIAYVPEKKFTPTHNNEKVIKGLKENISVAANAVGLNIDDQTIAYLPSGEKAQKAVQKFKEQYVDKEALRKVKERKENGKQPTIDDSTIIDVSLTNKVSKIEKEVEPSKVVTVDEAVDIIQRGKPEDKVHTVAEGEVLGELSSMYGLTQDELIEMNSELEKDEPLQIGQEINVTVFERLTEVVVELEGIKEESISYDTETVETDELQKGEKAVKQEGREGEKEVHYFIKKESGEIVEEKILNEETISKPVKEIILKGTKVTPSRGSGEFTWPAVGGTITSKQGSRWGDFHKGIDISGVSDRTIKAADNGVVISAGYDGSYGNKIVINHNNGYKTIYAHLSSISVSAGETVERGSAIGNMGTTGRSTGVHLHFEIYKNGSLQNPMSYY